MKKIFCVILSFLMLGVFTSCQKVEYKIYHMGTEDIEEEQNGNTITFFGSENLEFDGTKTVYDKKEKDALKSRIIDISDSETFNLEYVISKKMLFTESKNKKLSKFGHVDQYKLSVGKNEVTAEIDSRNDNLLFFSKFEFQYPNGSFTVEQAKEKAAEIISYALGIDALDGYVLTQANVILENQNRKKVTVVYEKQLYGYSTSETIKVQFDPSGSVVNFNARSYGTFDAVAGGLSKRKIQDAEKILTEALPKNAHIQDTHRLLLDAVSGVCYLEMVADGKSYYINIT